MNTSHGGIIAMKGIRKNRKKRRKELKLHVRRLKTKKR